MLHTSKLQTIKLEIEQHEVLDHLYYINSKELAENYRSTRDYHENKE